MSKKIASLFAEISADTTKLQQGLKDARGSLYTAEKELRKYTIASTELNNVLKEGGPDFRNLKNEVSGWVNQLKSATPENMEYANTLKYIVSEYQNGRLTVDQARTALERMEKQMEATNIPAKKMPMTLGDIKTAWIGIAAAVTAGIGIFREAGQAMQKLIGDYSNYAETMGKSAELSGILPEEMSRITQAADDMRVNVDSLKTSFALALKNGFVPTVDNLAKLADKLKDMTALERAAELSKIFGRSWQEIYPLLKDGGAAIRGATAAVADNLVVTGEAVKKNREYIKAVDDLGDAWTGVKNELAKGVIPALTEVIKTTTDASSGIQGMAGANLDGLERYRAAVMKANDATRGWNEKVNNVKDAAFSAAVGIDALTIAVEKETAAMNLVMASLSEVTKEMIFQKAAADMDSAAALELGRAMGVINEATYGTLSLLQQLREKYDLNKDGAISAAEATAGYTNEVLALSGAINGLQDKTVTVTTIFQQMREDAGASYIPGVDEDEYDGKKALGGSYKIPPGYNENYPVGNGWAASSGETVTVTPAGKSDAVQPINLSVTFTGSLTDRATAEKYARYTANYLKQRL
jgi:hypothetical protein